MPRPTPSPGRGSSGTVLVATCPHCGQRAGFALWIYSLEELQRKRSVSNSLIQLVCGKCGYDLAVGEPEVPALLELIGARRASRGRADDDPAFWQRVSEANLPSLNSLLIEAMTQPCPACGEDVPGNFETCWSCGGAVTPLFEAMPLPDHGKPVDFDPIFGFRPRAGVETEAAPGDDEPPRSQG